MALKGLLLCSQEVTLNESISRKNHDSISVQIFWYWIAVVVQCSESKCVYLLPQRWKTAQHKKIPFCIKQSITFRLIMSKKWCKWMLKFVLQKTARCHPKASLFYLETLSLRWSLPAHHPALNCMPLLCTGSVALKAIESQSFGFM